MVQMSFNRKNKDNDENKVFRVVRLGAYIILICNVIISYYHCLKLFQDLVHFPQWWLYHIGVVSLDTVFILSVIVLTESRGKGMPPWLCFLFGLSFTTWSNVRDAVKAGNSEGIAVGVSTVIALLLIKIMLTWMENNKHLFGVESNHQKTGEKTTGDYGYKLENQKTGYSVNWRTGYTGDFKTGYPEKLETQTGDAKSKTGDIQNGVGDVQKATGDVTGEDLSTSRKVEVNKLEKVEIGDKPPVKIITLENQQKTGETNKATYTAINQANRKLDKLEKVKSGDNKTGESPEVKLDIQKQTGEEKKLDKKLEIKTGDSGELEKGKTGEIKLDKSPAKLEKVEKKVEKLETPQKVESQTGDMDIEVLVEIAEKIKKEKGRVGRPTLIKLTGCSEHYAKLALAELKKRQAKQAS